MPPFMPPENYDVNLLRGDHIVRFNVIIPKVMNDQQREVINNFSRIETQNEERFYSKSEDQMRNQDDEKTKR